MVEQDKKGCLLCGCQKFKTVCQKFEHYLVRCSQCGLVYSWPPIPEDVLLQRYTDDYLFQEYLPIFKADRRSFQLDLIQSHYSFFLHLLDNYSGSGRKILDIGCGPGFFLKAASQKGWQGEGVEISEAAVEYANRIVGVKVHLGKIEDVDFPPESFDVITLLDSLEHLMDPLRVLCKCYKILKKRGFIIIDTPDYQSFSRFILGKDWAVLSPWEHLTNFSEKTLGLLLRKAGFIDFIIYNQFRFNPENTHNKNNFRYRLWKRMHEKIGRTRLFNKWQTFNQYELSQSLSILRECETQGVNPDLEKSETLAQKEISSRIAEERRIINKSGEDERGRGKIKSKIRSFISNSIRSYIRGDSLLAIAKK